MVHDVHCTFYNFYSYTVWINYEVLIDLNVVSSYNSINEIKLKIIYVLFCTT